MLLKYRCSIPSFVMSTMFLLFPLTSQGNEASSSTRAVLENYAAIALAGYEDSLSTAKELDHRIDDLFANPDKTTLMRARKSWKAARVYYQQTEVFRFGNPVVDGWEGRLNSWPLDEGLIDYVDSDYYGEESEANDLYVVNVIANPTLKISGKVIDASHITPDLLANILHEADGIEANVATGYHAIEFLLWGQDLNGTNPGAGDRPPSDYSLANCTGGNCDRRRAYLKAAVDLLISDLAWMVEAWKDGGAAQNEILKVPEKVGISRMLTGMGSLSYGELAGERMKLGLLLHDQEEEHDCFSDNTHKAHYYDAMGVENVYYGRYLSFNRGKITGPGLHDLVAARNSDLADDIEKALSQTMVAMSVLNQRVEDVEAYDQMIGENNPAGNAIIQDVIEALVKQAKAFEEIVPALDLDALKIERSDSLDNPGAVFK
jgi:putative iron-regulated protein